MLFRLGVMYSLFAVVVAVPFSVGYRLRIVRTPRGIFFPQIQFVNVTNSRAGYATTFLILQQQQLVRASVIWENTKFFKLSESKQSCRNVYIVTRQQTAICRS